MLNSCGVIIRKPLGHEYATLGIRAARAMLANGSLDVKVILMGDGIYSVLAQKGYVKAMFELFMSEGGDVYAVKQDVAERGLDEARLPDGVKSVAASEVSKIVLDTDSIMTF